MRKTAQRTMATIDHTTSKRRRLGILLPTWLAVVPALLLVPIALAPQPALAAEADFPAAHARAVAASPAGVGFTIEFAGERTRFRVGEIIPLDLVYRFDDASSYLINDGLAQGSGTARLLEVFRVSPQAGTRQRAPDEPNFSRGAGGSPQEPRGNRSYRYRVYLNEWRRFDTPGKYQLFGSSARVWRPNIWPQGNNDLRTASNVLTLEIIPATDSWRDEQFRAAVKVLEQSDDRAERRLALRRLRFLDTEPSARAGSPPIRRSG